MPSPFGPFGSTCSLVASKKRVLNANVTVSVSVNNILEKQESAQCGAP